MKFFLHFVTNLSHLWRTSFVLIRGSSISSIRKLPFSCVINHVNLFGQSYNAWCPQNGQRHLLQDLYRKFDHFADTRRYRINRWNVTVYSRGVFRNLRGVCKILSYEWFKIDVSEAKNCHILLKNVPFEAWYTRWRSLACQLLVLYSLYVQYVSSFSFLKSWYNYAHFHPNRFTKWRHH